MYQALTRVRRTLDGPSSCCLVVAFMLLLGVGLGAEGPADLLKEASESLARVLDMPEGVPQDLLDKAECVVILPSVIKAGFIVGGSYGGGLAAQVHTTSFLDRIVAGIQYPPGSLPFDQHVALGMIEPDALASLPVYPVQLYEVALLGVLILLLSRVSWRRAPRGTLAVLTIVGYAVMRFFIGYLRADGHIVLGNLTITQLQCILLSFTIVLLPRLRRSVVS